ncbi:MAG: hypothetical protein FWG58_01620, partial [Methanomassiliicoccaceae archaeon]|nr:hypothetical protein [Methanomassiliicoccaceae archaeon]
MRYVHALTMLVVAALLISPLAYVLSSERDDRSRVEETGGDITPVPWDGVTAPWSAPGTQAFATSPSGSGDPGNENNPFLIRSAGELKLLSEMINDNEISAGDKQKYNGTDTYYELTEDILLNDVSSISIWGDGFVPKNIWTPIGWYETSSNSPFEANFNGNDHTVSGVYINNGKDSQGLFGYVTGNVKDLGIDKSFIRGGGTVGGIAGELSGGSITGCSNKGTVTGDTIVGGIAGRAVDSDIMNCYNEGNVRGIGAGAGYAGGTVGLLDHSGLTNCYNAGSVTVTSVDAGGIAGVSSNGSSMTNCFNIGDVKGNVSVGGVVGMISGDSITNCYNAGTVTGNSATGGVFGIGLGSIANCYYLDPAGPSGISFGGNG